MSVCIERGSQYYIGDIVRYEVSPCSVYVVLLTDLLTL